MLLKRKAEDEFLVDAINTDTMDKFIKQCVQIYQSKPEWLDEKDHIKTINFAKSICSEVARLATLAIGITVDGSARADWLQQQIENVYFNLRHWVEYGCVYGTVILKPNGTGIDLFTPDRFLVTECVNDKITGVIFYFQKKLKRICGTHDWNITDLPRMALI